MLSYPVIIVDDHPVVGHALSGLLQRHPSVSSLEVYESASAAIHAIADRPQGYIVILDLDMPDISGLDLVRLLPKPANIDLRVLIYTGQGSLELEVAAIRSGAKGFVSKDADLSVFLQAFECVVSQRSYFSDKALQTALTEFASPDQEKLARLSAREYMIAKRLAAGESNSSIAEALFISPKTVSAHKANLFEKLEISTIPQLIQILQVTVPRS